MRFRRVFERVRTPVEMSALTEDLFLQDGVDRRRGPETRLATVKRSGDVSRGEDRRVRFETILIRVEFAVKVPIESTLRRTTWQKDDEFDRAETNKNNKMHFGRGRGHVTTLMQRSDQPSTFN